LVQGSVPLGELFLCCQEASSECYNRVQQAEDSSMRKGTADEENSTAMTSEHEMSEIIPEPDVDNYILPRAEFGKLLEALKASGYCTVGPTLRDQAIVFAEIESEADLPAGWTDEQEAGKYRLRRRDDLALFGYAVGPHSWKQFLFPSRLHLCSAHKRDGAFDVQPGDQDAPRYAFIGVRSCDLHAIVIQDRVFMGTYKDPTYAKRREKAFIVALNCGVAGGTCFCVSMHTGPEVTGGYDLVMTEVLQEGTHYFVLKAGSIAGQEILRDLPCYPATPYHTQAARAVVDETAEHMGRSMKSDDVKELLYKNFDHPRWDDVASRCLTCANCTLVCPTCFCSTVEDVTDLTGDHAERWRLWDSCFTIDFTHLAGAGSVRQSTRARYRQWMTHKLATWWDQFGTTGCIGCGRCITWCPVGIDITEEVRAIRESPMGQSQASSPAGTAEP
jgi:sulfhydrogenase subunit beta (sulfur reductase)